MNPPAIAYISLGSNIEPRRNLHQAVVLLATKVTILEASSIYRTPPQGFTQQADFCNMAVKIKTQLPPITLKQSVLDWIEQELGRKHDPLNKNAPRTIDLDISLWDSTVFEYGDKPWHIPDPDILRFAHVAIPLAEIAPDYLHPEEHKTLASIAASFNESFQKDTF